MGSDKKPSTTDLPAATQALLATEQPFSFAQVLPHDQPMDKAIILLHGMFHNANAMLYAARDEIRFHEPSAGLFAINAPFPADPGQHLPAQKPRKGAGFRMWYALPKGRLYPRREILPAMQLSVRHVQKMIAHIKRNYGLREHQIHILAFSQGCAPAMQTIVESERKGRPLASAALLCGHAWDPDIFPATQPQSLPTPPLEDAAPPPPPAPTEPVAARWPATWIDPMVSWVLRKREASAAPAAAPDLSAAIEDEDDVVQPSILDVKGRTPIFYAFIEQDDTVPIGLSWYTATFMRRHNMPVALHISPSYTARVEVQKSRLVRQVRMERPTYLRFRSKLWNHTAPLKQPPLSMDETTAQLPVGHKWIKRPHALIHISQGDDGFGNQLTKLHDIRMRVEIDSHWVNPSIRHALTLWHVHGLLDPASGVAPLHKTKLPKIGQNEVEYGWAINPTRLDSEKPPPPPPWLRPTLTFNSLRAELRHVFWSFAAQAALAISRPIHHWFLHEPDPNERTFISHGRDALDEKAHANPARAAYLKAARAHFEQLEKESDAPKPRKKPTQGIDNA